MSKRTTQVLARMKTLAAGIHDNLWELLGCADKVLSDSAWVEKTYKGSVIDAQDALAEQYFGPVKGVMALGTMLAIYRAIPEREVWEKHHFDLMAMHSLWREMQLSDRDTEPRAERTSYKQKAVELEEETAKLSTALKRVEEDRDRYGDELAQLREENRRLREENAQLNGRIVELERMVSRDLQTA